MYKKIHLIDIFSLFSSFRFDYIIYAYFICIASKVFDDVTN